MTMPAQTSRPTPERIFQSLNAYQLSAALKAAIELDVFSAIGAGKNSIAAIASHCHTSERGARILCDYLVVQGFVTKDGGRYALAPDAAVFLDRQSPTYIGSCANFIVSPLQQDEFRKLADAVRKGGTVMGPEGSLAPDHPMWVEFARAMAPLQRMMAEMIANLVGVLSTERCKILDIAAGHGMFGITLARHNADAEIYAVDWPSVLDVARQNAQQAGIASRYHSIPGDAFSVDFGSEYDLVLLTNFLHHCDPRAIEAFMRKVYAALKPGGRAITLEFIPNDDRVSPPTPASFALVMLANTPSGDAYTLAEYNDIFRKVGFLKNELHVLPSTHSVIISTK
jgi:2-polyprenyl-3-methyl-5-hydroxy-6-metoxy-1,4-benzoquinol methylase